MKSTLLRLSVLLLTFSVGIAIPLLFKRHDSIESSLAVPSPAVRSLVSSGCPGADYLWKDMPVVISVPNDGEFYLGKRKLELSEISDSVSKMLGNISTFDDRVVYIKSDAHVRFETVSLVADQVKLVANVKSIEFVLDKRKKAGY